MYLVTGANGFIGSRLCGALVKQGHDVRRVFRSTASLEQGQYSSGDIACDFSQTNLQTSDFKLVSTVVHLAGIAHDVSGSLENHNRLYRKINIEATLELARQAILSGVKRFIFVSSVKAGGHPGGRQCASEADQFPPQGIYAETKREAETGLIELSQQCDMELVIVRPALVYGPAVRGNLQSMFELVKKGIFPPLPETGNRRSLVHIDDLVRAILFLDGHQQARNGTFIVSDGQPYSTREIYESICVAAGRKVPKWSIPVSFFNLAAKMHPRIKFKLDKLLGDECYSSEKLQSLGFIATKELNSAESWYSDGS